MAEQKDDAHRDDQPDARSDEAYTVGYGKPPRHTQFKPGQSGNPRRGKARKLSLSEEVGKVLAMPIKVTEGGGTRHISTYRAAALQLRKMALSGNMRALQCILDLGREQEPHAPVSGDMTAEDEQLLTELLASHRQRTGKIDED